MMASSSELQGLVAIVTGGGRGIGRATALVLAHQGADVVVVDLDCEPAEETAHAVSQVGRRSLAIQMNVADRGGVQAMSSHVINKLGRIDILVNNAALCGWCGVVEDITEEEWDRTLSVNLKGTFLCCQAVIPAMKAQRFGRIVNVSSAAGQLGASEPGVDYASSKGAVLALTKSLARYLLPDGVTVNALAPGQVMTRMHDWRSLEEHKRKLAKIPLGRMAEPEEIARGVIFLTSPEASYITGMTLDIAGGTVMI
jgi:NAD(P)-dependent dehydrogenase (short-subunit alcohol dehydrogenase family)